MRALYNNLLKNVAGKVRTERRWGPVDVPEGIDQVCDSCFIFSGRISLIDSNMQSFVQFDCGNPKDELEKRFQYFTTQVRIRLHTTCCLRLPPLCSYYHRC